MLIRTVLGYCVKYIHGMWLYYFARTLYKEICFVAFNFKKKYQTFDLISEIPLSLDAQITLITHISMIDMELEMKIVC